MKKLTLYITLFVAMLLPTACSQDLDSPVLSEAESLALPNATAMDSTVIFGIWSSTTSYGNTNNNYFEQSYKISFQDLSDGEAVFSHWFTDASSEMKDSVIDYEYTYTFDGKHLTLCPKAAYALLGADTIKGVSIGNNRILLYTDNQNRIDSICTINRIGDPVPSITIVDRTLPSVGDTVTIYGRNLQFVDHVYLPTTSGEKEMTDTIRGSKQIKVIIPKADYAPGSVRCQSTTAHESCYSPAYMFRNDCIFFHNFISNGFTSPYTGSEFEFSIKSMGTLKSSVSNISSSNLPAGHSLQGISNISNPDSLLSMFGDKPISWPIATGTDNKKGYLRFSSGDRFQHVLDSCSGGLSSSTLCSNAAIQMDIYVYSNGQPVWNSGYLSYRLNKDVSSLSNSMTANVASWSEGAYTSFAHGWYTFTIPLSDFTITNNSSTSTLGGLISLLKSSNLQTIMTVVNYTLDDLHPAKSLDSFQFNIANIRLVPYGTPANTKE